MIYFKLIPFFFFLLTTGCSFRTAESDRKSQPLPFEVLPVTQIKVDTSKVDPVWGLATQKLFHLKTCIKDTHALKPVAGETFKLRHDQKVKTLNPSDSEGCIYWSQNIDFKPLVKETFVSQTLVLESSLGSLPLKLAFSPWENSVTDLRYLSQVSPLTKEELSGDALMGRGAFSLQPRDFEEGTNLVIENVEVLWERNNTRDHNAFFDFNVQLKVHALRKNNQSTLTPVSLPQGKVLMALEILEKKKSKTETVELVWEDKEFEGKIQDGRLNLKSHLVSLNRPLNLNSELMLYLDIRAVDSHVGLLPYRGIVMLSGFNPVSRTPDNITLTSSSNQWRKPTDNLSIAKKTFELRTPLSFRILDRENDFDPVQLTTKVQVEVTACLNDVFSHSMIDNHPLSFALSSKDHWVPSLPISEGIYLGSGCYKWTGVLDRPVSIYGKQELRQDYFYIYSKSSPYENISQSFPLLIDPLRTDDATITHLGTRDHLRKTDYTEPEISVNQSTFTFLGENYEVNSHLQLALTKHYQFEFLPQLNRPETNDRNLHQSPLLSGTQVKVKGVLIDKDLDNQESFVASVWDHSPKRYLASFETTGLVKGANGFRVRVPFKIGADINQLPRLDSPTWLLIEISLMGAGEKPKPKTFVYAFKFNRNERTIALVPADDITGFSLDKYLPKQDIAERENEGVQYQWRMKNLGADSVRSFLDFYRKYYGTLHENDPARKVDVENVDLNKLVESFCDTTSSEKASCLKAPHFYFRAHRFDWVTAAKVSPHKNVVSRILPQQVLSSRILKQQVVSERETQGDRASKEYSRNENIKMGFEELGNGLTKNISLSKKEETFRATEEVFTSDTNQSNFSTASINLNARVLLVPLDIKYLSCVLVEPTSFTVSVLPRESYLFCGNSKTKESLIHPWYFLKEGNDSSLGSLDSEQFLFQGWWKIIRGREHYERFTREVILGSREYGIRPMQEKKEADADIEKKMEIAFEDPYLAGASGNLPGFLTVSSASHSLWTAEESQQFFLKFYFTKIKNAGSDAEKRTFVRYYRCFTDMASREIPYRQMTKQTPEGYRKLLDTLLDKYHDACLTYAEFKK